MNPEAILQDSCFKVLKKLGIKYFHIAKGPRKNKFKRAGFPDILFGKGGNLFAVELKTKTGKVEPEQEIWLDTIHREWGGTVGVVRSEVEFSNFLHEVGVLK